MPFPSSDTLNPLVFPDGTTFPGVVFLNAAIDHPRIEIGDYSYMSTFDAPPDPADFASRLAPYLHAGSPEKLVMGRFCQVAYGVTIITSSANHRFDGISSYPFAIFDQGMAEKRPSLPAPGRDTIIGHDVWFGHGATVLPGARIGSGVIVGAGAVVGGEVPDYAIVGGNPGCVRRMRFSPDDVERLLGIAWWNWPIGTILAHETEICGGDIAALESIAESAQEPSVL
jgi:virginiamycin A acetyltransferase